MAAPPARRSGRALQRVHQWHDRRWDHRGARPDDRHAEDTRARRRLSPVRAGGFVVYATAGTLRAIRFDPTTLTASGNPLPVLDHVASKGTGAADVSVSRDGTMAYFSGAQSVLDLASFDRQGREERLNLPPRAYLSLRFSPDGQRIALDIRDQENDIWIWDVSRRTLTETHNGRFHRSEPGLDAGWPAHRLLLVAYGRDESVLAGRGRHRERRTVDDLHRMRRLR